MSKGRLYVKWSFYYNNSYLVYVSILMHTTQASEHITHLPHRASKGSRAPSFLSAYCMRYGSRPFYTQRTLSKDLVSIVLRIFCAWKIVTERLQCKFGVVERRG